MSSADRDGLVRRAGRGFLFILGAKAYFLVSGYAILVALSWILGPVLYGVYGLVVGAISVLDNVIVTGTIQGVSRFTAEARDRAGQVKAAALKMQLLLGGGVAITFVALSPLIAAFERDDSLTPYLRLSAGIVLFYAFYSVFIGTANGQRRFGLQAGLDALYATIRGSLIVGLAWAFAVWGAIAGFVVASFVILLVAIVVVGVRDARAGFPVGRLVRFVLPVMAYLLLVNLAMFADLFILKRFAAEALAALPDPELAAAEGVGIYVAVQQLARVTYQALLAVTFVIFPLVSASTFDRDSATTRSYIESTMRYSLVFAGGMTVLLAAVPAQMMRLPFGESYAIGAGALAVLAIGYGFFSLFVVATTILNAAGQTRVAFAVTALTLGIECAACWVLIPRATTQEGLLVAAAAAATGAMAVGWILATVALRQLFRARLGLLSLARVLLAFGAAAGVGSLMPLVSRVVTLAEVGAVGVVFLVVLFASGELGRADLGRLATVLGRRR